MHTYVPKTRLLPHPIPSHPSKTSSHNLDRPPSPNPPPRSPQPIHTPLLPPPEPRLQRVPQHALAHKVDDQPANDAHKRNGVHPVDALVEDLDADDDAPEVAREQGDVEEGGRGEPEDEGGAGVEDQEAEGVAGHVAADFAVVPDRRLVAVSIEDAAHGAVDDHAPEAQLAHDFVERSLAHQELLRHVAHAVKSGADQCEEVAFELVAAGDSAEAGTLRDVVGAEEDAHAANADEDADDLGGMVADVEENEGDDDDHYDGPEIDELCYFGTRVSIAFSQGDDYELLGEGES